MERACMREKVCYGIGGMTYMIELSVMLSFLTLFCSDVMQMDVTVLGIVIAATKIVDAISDILITNLADHTQTRYGKYRIWFLMGIPLGIFLFISFLYPSFLTTQLQKTIWVSLIYILTVPIFETAVTAPVIVLNTTMSADSQDRMDFSLARALGEAGGQVLTSLCCMTIILAFGSYKSAEGWRVMGAVMGAAVIVCGLTGFFGVRERVYIPNTTADGNRLRLRDKLTLLHANAPFWKCVTMLVGFMIQYYGSMAMFPYFCIYNLGHAQWQSSLMAIGFAVQTAAVLLIFFLNRYLEKRTIAILGGCSLLAAALLLLSARDYSSALLYQVFFGIGNGFLNTISFAMMPDISDYTQWKTGVAIPGILAAIATFAMKLSGAAATLFVTQVLTRAHYDAQAAVQSAATCTSVRWSYVLLCFAAAVVTIIAAISLKEIDHAKIKQYQQESVHRAKSISAV